MLKTSLRTIFTLSCLLFTSHNIFSATTTAAPKANSPTTAPKVAATPSKAAAPSTVAPVLSGNRLDQVTVKRLYGDGDFDQAISMLENFEKSQKQFTREESLTVYKFLGVMYSATPATREKGKSYFYKLLKVDPDAKILDMYVSIVVQDIFKNTLDELMEQQGHKPNHNNTTASQGQVLGQNNNGKTGKQQKIEEEDHTVIWWIGGLGLAAGLAGGYYLYSQSGSTPAKDSEIKVP